MSTTSAPNTTEAPAFAYPELPQAEDPAFDFWCVYLEGYAGPTPALPKQVKEAPVHDVERPWEELGFTIPTNAAEQHQMENLKPRLRKQRNGRLDMQEARRWQHAFDHSQRYYEDPAHAAKGVNPRVIGVGLYCPLNEAIGPNGTLEDHGPYAAKGSTGVNGLPMSGTPGACPRCRTPQQKAAALREIANRFQWANIDMPPALTAKLQAWGA